MEMGAISWTAPGFLKCLRFVMIACSDASSITSTSPSRLHDTSPALYFLPPLKKHPSRRCNHYHLPMATSPAFPSGPDKLLQPRDVHVNNRGKRYAAASARN